MVDDSPRIFPRSVLQADTIIVTCGLANFERTSWSTQRFLPIWGLRDELATVADNDKFLGSFEANYRGVCDGHTHDRRVQNPVTCCRATSNGCEP